MTALTTLLLAVSISLGPTTADVTTRTPSVGGSIHVDCTDDAALGRALGQAARLGGATIVLHGLCKGPHTIATGNVALVGADPGSGLRGDGVRDVLIVDGVAATLRDMTIRDGRIGVLVEGWESSAFLSGVRLDGNVAGAVASRGGDVTVLDSEILDGEVGLVAQYNSTLNLQRTTIRNQDDAVTVFDRSQAALTDAVLEDNRRGGLALFLGSRANVFGTTLRRNGQVHVFAGDRSDASLANDVIIGDDGDDTDFALGADDRSTIGSFSSPRFFGDVYASDGSSIGLGNVAVDGIVIVDSFSDSRLFRVELTGPVVCDQGGRASCNDVTAPAVIGCDPALCAGPPPPAAAATPRPQPPTIEARPFPTGAPR